MRNLQHFSNLPACLRVKVNNRNTRKSVHCVQIIKKKTIQERCHPFRSGVFIDGSCSLHHFILGVIVTKHSWYSKQSI